MPRVSVIVPAHNAERTIGETIRSVRAQTFSDFELIVIDDGSTDRTLDRLEAAGDSRLQVFSYENAGESRAFNRGIARATGEFVAFLHADDLWTPDKLESQVAALEARPAAGVAYSWTRFVDRDGCDLYEQRPVFFEGDVYRELLVANFTCSGSNVLVRRQAVEAAGGFDVSLEVSPDWEFCVRLAARWPFVVVPRHQILYRQWSGSKSSSMAATPESWEERGIRTIERVFEAVPADLQPLKKRRLATFYLHFAHRTLVSAADRASARLAGRNLWRALRLDPRLVRDPAGRRVLARWLLMRVLPWRAAGWFRPPG
jgi:glycosyltransferase involved in cell wall biosynthesis